MNGIESHVERFRTAVVHRFGLRFDATRLGQLAEVLERRIAQTGETRERYIERLERACPSRDETHALARELTVGETYFFRNIEQFHALAEVALPARVAARAAERKLRILSAGCATGEEAYSLAISVRQHLLEPDWEVSITGVDVNDSALARASLGRYSDWSLREAPAELQRRWFLAVSREHAIDPSIRAAVRFQERNLAEEDPELWLSEAYDVVFCRNVLMYLTPDAARGLVARIGRALAPGGYLFLGHAETLRGLSHDFHLHHTHETFYYERKNGISRDAGDSRPDAEPQRALPAAAIPDGAWTATWLETVRRSADRIETLSEQAGTGGATATRSGDNGTAVEVGRAVELLRSERFEEALHALGSLARASAQDPDVLLLRAVLLAHSGQLEAAERVCTELCELDELNAGAHYVRALCRAGAGDPRSAEDHDRMAAYLDPSFAMPRLHLGLLDRRAGNRAGARREFERALDLLTHEDPSRILLFGGGFTREALTRLCLAELRAMGGAP
jgi:chemotaxis protein methyltransferase CheR